MRPAVHVPSRVTSERRLGSVDLTVLTKRWLMHSIKFMEDNNLKQADRPPNGAIRNK